jgi:hypothetical protein
MSIPRSAPQPIPEHAAEGLRLAGSGRTLPRPRLPSRLRDRATAAEALKILFDVDPPYPVIDTSRPAVPLAVAAPQPISALGARHAG